MVYCSIRITDIMQFISLWYKSSNYGPDCWINPKYVSSLSYNFCILFMGEPENWNVSNTIFDFYVLPGLTDSSSSIVMRRVIALLFVMIGSMNSYFIWSMSGRRTAVLCIYINIQLPTINHISCANNAYFWTPSRLFFFCCCWVWRS